MSSINYFYWQLAIIVLMPIIIILSFIITVIILGILNDLNNLIIMIHNYTFEGCIEKNGMDYYLLIVKCSSCKKEFKIYVDPAGYKQWTKGVPIQKALPDLTEDQRELLISNTCDACFIRLES